MILDYKHLNPKGNKTIVLIHGFLENNLMFDDYLDFFMEKNFQVLTYNLPGHGLSSCPATPFSIADIAHSIEDDLNKLNAQNISVLGHSMGGYVALALEESVHLDHLVLLNSTPNADSKWKKEDRLRAIEAMKQNKNLFINMAIPNLFGVDYRGVLSDEIEKAKAIALSTDDAGVEFALLAMRSRPAFDLQFLDAQVSLILGANDNIIPLDKMEQHLNHQNVKTFIHEKAGHMIHLEERSWLLNCLEDIF